MAIWLRCESEMLLNVESISNLSSQKSMMSFMMPEHEPKEKEFYVEAMTRDRGYCVARVDTEAEAKAILIGIRKAIEAGEPVVD